MVLLFYIFIFYISLLSYLFN
ncbi:hypothetical protein PFTANZ_04883 [Plasmodium falciparum Tanzania (2000708)]|uniref:Uncharacterized protein n=1 Tax=Plasmodium falciparum Tanzania (2000708) TaxID=1036725 RepID=A0A024W1I4_PLAFA|nr:hypothetical protein PFTANZ_04883 [Plasmodium falciparum Tanzania (2000708)]